MPFTCCKVLLHCISYVYIYDLYCTDIFTSVRDLSTSFTTVELCQRLQMCSPLSHSLVSWVVRLGMTCGFREHHGTRSGDAVGFLEQYVSSSLSPSSFLSVTGNAQHRCTRTISTDQEQITIKFKLDLFGFTTFSSL